MGLHAKIVPEVCAGLDVEDLFNLKQSGIAPEYREFSGGSSEMN
jgi:hypothetical protein